jgi:3-oxoacyl-[acyl-carrier protein] reductase
MPSETGLARRVAFVTGGSNGIGAATVRRLAEAGASVVIGYKTGEARARALMAELPGEGHSVQPLAVEDSQSAKQATHDIAARYGRLDILVNSAGFTRPVPHADLDALDDGLIDAIMAVNVRGPFALIRALAPLMKQDGGGVIVNVSSIAGFTGAGSNIAYGASKAALDTMTMSLARVLAPEIRILSVSPGAVATDFVAGRDRAALEKLAQSTPLKRVIEPDEVAAAIMACITHLTATTGARIVVDGGRFL